MPPERTPAVVGVQSRFEGTPLWSHLLSAPTVVDPGAGAGAWMSVHSWSAVDLGPGGVFRVIAERWLVDSTRARTAAAWALLTAS